MSSIHRFTGEIAEQKYAWEGVEPIEINTDTIHGILKHVLIGPKDGAPNFIIRYFQVPVGESSFLHQHPHEHGIVILNGKAKAQINESYYDLEPLSALFIQCGDLHQLTNIGDYPLGFICVIPAGAE